MTAHRVTEDHSVTDWEQTAKKTRRSFRATATTLGTHAIIFAPAVLVSVLPASDSIRRLAWTMGVFISLAILLVFRGGAESDEFYNSRAARRNIRKARRTAKRVSGATLTVLTKEHVEARSRMADAIEQFTLYGGVGVTINRAEREAIYLLVFENLIREPVVISLIEDRHMTTAQEIREALVDMETRPVALWDGSL